MSTTPLTDAINALTQYANETTGASDTTLSDAVGTLVAGYGGGGSMGGLANMVDVSDQDYAFGYMLSAMKNGNTVGGTVTYSDNFPNTESLLLSTGLTTLHGFMFVNPATDVSSSTGPSAVNKTLFAFVKQDQTWDFIGVYSNTIARSYNNANNTAIAAPPVNGTLRISGGDIYYTGRYNKNGNYQILASNTLYEWLAW